MDLGITNRRAVVGAATSGLGLATAMALREAGVRVVICGRNEQRLQNALELINASNTAATLSGQADTNVAPTTADGVTICHDAIGLIADLSNPSGAAQFIEQARSELGGIDICVTNSGGPKPGGFLDIEVDEYRSAIDQNMLAMAAMVKETIDGMIEQRWGRILAITSISVRHPISSLIMSNTARAGLTSMLKTLSSDVAKFNITVNTIQPGLHLTPRVEQLYNNPEMMQQAADRVPSGVLGDPSDFGKIAAFMCSEQAKFLNGVSLPVDGGAFPGMQ